MPTRSLQPMKACVPIGRGECPDVDGLDLSVAGWEGSRVDRRVRTSAWPDGGSGGIDRVERDDDACWDPRLAPGRRHVPQTQTQPPPGRGRTVVVFRPVEAHGTVRPERARWRGLRGDTRRCPWSRTLVTLGSSAVDEEGRR